MYATIDYVDRAEERVNRRVDLLKEDIDALSGTVVELLHGQRRLETNVHAIMTHLGVPEVPAPDPDDT